MLAVRELPRVLLEKCLPQKLGRAFAGCTVSTVPAMGWAGKKNGELMEAACGQFEVFVTADQNLRYQQNLAYAEIAVLVLVASDNRIESLMPLIPQVNAHLRSIVAGQVIEIEAPPHELDE